MIGAAGHGDNMKTVPTSAGLVDIWQTPLGWRFAPVEHPDPEAFSEQYADEEAATEQAHLWSAEWGEENDDEGWLE